MPPQSSHDTNRVKFVYNAQFPAPTAVVLDYLLRNEQFTPRQGRQLGMDAMMAFYRPMAEAVRGELSESDRQAIAHQCVKQLAQQIDELCTRYHLPSPLHSRSTSTTGDVEYLAATIEQGFQRLSEALPTITISIRSLIRRMQQTALERTCQGWRVQPRGRICDLRIAHPKLNTLEAMRQREARSPENSK